VCQALYGGWQGGGTSATQQQKLVTSLACVLAGVLEAAANAAAGVLRCWDPISVPELPSGASGHDATAMLMLW
jgi:hypothetical protein